MTLGAGTRLGPYEIQTPLGAGGMGEVYRARDTRLDRIVAVKVLPSHTAADPQFRERFEREARAISALDHPSICALYDVGETEGTSYLVMQFLEGQTLAERIARGPLPLNEALTIAIQIAEALTAAHRAGIIHRDLKPANVMLLRNSGTMPVAKLLDFGLAKVAAAAVQVAAATPTRTQEPLTAQGTILGTFQYIAPEQIEGEEADARSDIFSFGVVLFEMLSGRRAFEGKTHASLFGAILKEHPPALSSLQAQAPPALDQLLRACLAKNPNDRIQTAHDVLLQLRWIAEGGAQITTMPPKRTQRERWLAAAAALFALTTVAVAGLWFTTRATPSAPALVARFMIGLEAKQAFTRTGRHYIALSPDGYELVYVANNQLFLRRLNELEASPIRGTDIDPIEPFFSPDGRWIGFVSNGELRKVPIEGGSSVRLATVQTPFGATWTAAGIFLGQRSSIIRVPADGGTPETVVSASAGSSIGHPHLLPDGRTVLYTRTEGATPNWQMADAVLHDLADGRERVIARGGGDYRYASTGHLIFARGEEVYDIYAARFRLGDDRAESAVPVVERVRSGGASGAVQFALSSNGVAAYVSSATIQTTALVWVDRQGRQTPISIERPFEDFALSPDRARIAVTLQTTPPSVWIVDLSRQTVTRLTFSGDRRDPFWTPDGQQVAYTSVDGGAFWKPADGSGREEQLLPPDGSSIPFAFSPDGKWLLYRDRVDPQSQSQLKALAMGGHNETPPQLPERVNDAAVSPDGRWLAYVAGEGNARGELFVAPFPQGGGRWQVSQAASHDPEWHPNSRELFFRNGNEVVAVAIEPGAAFNASAPKVLFNASGFANRGPDFGYDPKTDRFMLIPEGPGGGQIHVIVNWFDELRQRVPTERR